MSAVGHAVIAVAGLGSRLGRGMPKCLVEVAGKSIIQYQLDLLEEVPDVRLVVGYLEHEVISKALSIRPDITIVRNPDYRVTTTQRSYWLGSRYLVEPCLYLDGDIVFEPKSFREFLCRAAGETPLVGITEAKTVHPVYADVQAATADAKATVSSFSRVQCSKWEWANIAYLPQGMLEENGGDVFRRLETFLPLDAANVNCYEVDTEEDLKLAEAFAAQYMR